MTLPPVLLLAGAGAPAAGLAVLALLGVAGLTAHRVLDTPRRARPSDAEPPEPQDRHGDARGREFARLQRAHALVTGIQAAARHAREREALLGSLAVLATRAGGYRLAWVALYDPAGRVFAPLPQADSGAEPLAVHRLPLEGAGTGGVAGALLAGRAVVSRDLARDPRLGAVRAQALACGLRSCAYLPLRTGGEVAGALGLYAEPAGFFDAAEMALLRQVADAVSLCLDYLDTEEALHHLAYYDSLTGLPNRVLFTDRLDQALARERTWRRHVAVLMAHVDRFKELNSLHGHLAGDALLREIARRLCGTVRTGDTIARTGTAAFGIILTDVAQPADAALVARKIARAFEAPVEIDDRELYVSLGIGVSVAPGDGNDAETLLRNADTALHAAGSESGTRFRLYTREIDARVRGRFELEGELRRAIERGELALHYQPIVELASLNVVGAEALLRWHSARLGPVAPELFVPIAERCGLIVPIGEWSLRQAAGQARRWRRLGLPSRVAINTSALQLRDTDFVSRVQAILAENDEGGVPLALDLEITESNLMENAEHSAECLRRLRGRGLAVSIDDFGTGYSSLTYLRRLPVDTLKIEMGFVRDLTHDPEDAAIVRAIIALARSLELTVVAEGVETPEQLALLRELGCDAAQGFFFSPAVTAERFERLSRTGFGALAAAR